MNRSASIPDPGLTCVARSSRRTSARIVSQSSWFSNSNSTSWRAAVSPMSLPTAARARRFHASLPTNSRPRPVNARTTPAAIHPAQCHAGGHDRAQRHAMHDVGFDVGDDGADRRHLAPQLQRIEGAAPPLQRQQVHAGIRDRARMPVDARGHPYVMALGNRGARQLQAVRREVPVLGRQKQELRPGWHRRALASTCRSVCAAAVPR